MNDADKKTVVTLARAAADAPEVSIWDRIADFFDRRREDAKEVVQPRK